MDVPSILDSIDSSQSQHVVITGGEPMLQKQLASLCKPLRQHGYHITIETAGTVDQRVECDLMSISPKLANSTPRPANCDHPNTNRWTARHESSRHRPEVIRRLIARYDYQLKFVIDQPADCDLVEKWLGQFEPIDPGRVWLMPQGTVQHELTQVESWLRPWCDSMGFQFCPRMHIAWYGNKRGT